MECKKVCVNCDLSYMRPWNNGDSKCVNISECYPSENRPDLFVLRRDKRECRTCDNWLLKHGFITEEYKTLKGDNIKVTGIYVDCPYCQYRFGVNVEHITEVVCSKCKKVFTI